jgi:uncharacterized protein
MGTHIVLNRDEKKGEFSISIDQKEQGIMTFVMAGEDKMIIDHTEVFQGNEGKGLGKLLVAEAVNYARKNDIKIMPLCPFAKKVFDKTAEYKDVLW